MDSDKHDLNAVLENARAHLLMYNKSSQENLNDPTKEITNCKNQEVEDNSGLLLGCAKDPVNVVECLRSGVNPVACPVRTDEMSRDSKDLVPSEADCEDDDEESSNKNFDSSTISLGDQQSFQNQGELTSQTTYTNIHELTGPVKEEIIVITSPLIKEASDDTTEVVSNTTDSSATAAETVTDGVNKSEESQHNQMDGTSDTECPTTEDDTLKETVVTETYARETWDESIEKGDGSYAAGTGTREGSPVRDNAEIIQEVALRLCELETDKGKPASNINFNGKSEFETGESSKMGQDCNPQTNRAGTYDAQLVETDRKWNNFDELYIENVIGDNSRLENISDKSVFEDEGFFDSKDMLDTTKVTCASDQEEEPNLMSESKNYDCLQSSMLDSEQHSSVQTVDEVVETNDSDDEMNIHPAPIKTNCNGNVDNQNEKEKLLSNSETFDLILPNLEIIAVTKDGHPITNIIPDILHSLDTENRQSTIENEKVDQPSQDNSNDLNVEKISEVPDKSKISFPRIVAVLNKPLRLLPDQALPEFQHLLAGSPTQRILTFFNNEMPDSSVKRSTQLDNDDNTESTSHHQTSLVFKYSPCTSENHENIPENSSTANVDLEIGAEQANNELWPPRPMIINEDPIYLIKSDFEQHPPSISAISSSIETNTRITTTNNISQSLTNQNSLMNNVQNSQSNIKLSQELNSSTILKTITTQCISLDNFKQQMQRILDDNNEDSSENFLYEQNYACAKKENLIENSICEIVEMNSNVNSSNESNFTEKAAPLQTPSSPRKRKLSVESLETECASVVMDALTDCANELSPETQPVLSSDLDVDSLTYLRNHLPRIVRLDCQMTHDSIQNNTVIINERYSITKHEKSTEIHENVQQITNISTFSDNISMREEQTSDSPPVTSAIVRPPTPFTKRRSCRSFEETPTTIGKTVDVLQSVTETDGSSNISEENEKLEGSSAENNRDIYSSNPDLMDLDRNLNTDEMPRNRRSHDLPGVLKHNEQVDNNVHSPKTAPKPPPRMRKPNKNKNRFSFIKKLFGIKSKHPP